MPNVDLMDETFVVASRQAVSDALHDPKLWRNWWPDLDLVVEKDRGVSGLQFSVTGGLVGSGELWLEAWGDGVIVHVFLRADPTRPGTATEPATLKLRQIWREARKRAWQTKRGMGRLKDDLEAGRPAGEPGADEPQSASTSSAAVAATAAPDGQRSGTAASGATVASGGVAASGGAISSETTASSATTASPSATALSEGSAPEAGDLVTGPAEVSTPAAAGGVGAEAAAGNGVVGASGGSTAG